MREKIRQDIEEFLRDNPRNVHTSGKSYDELTSWEKMYAYLAWNGIQGYTDEIIEAVELSFGIALTTRRHL